MLVSSLRCVVVVVVVVVVVGGSARGVVSVGVCFRTTVVLVTFCCRQPHNTTYTHWVYNRATPRAKEGLTHTHNTNR